VRHPNPAARPLTRQPVRNRTARTAISARTAVSARAPVSARAAPGVVAVLAVLAALGACAAPSATTSPGPPPGARGSIGAPASTDPPTNPAPDPTSAPPSSPLTAAPTTGAAPAATPPAPRPEARSSFSVATTRRTFVDTDRSRTLLTTIYYPSPRPTPSMRPLGTMPTEASADAPPAAGPFPLVLMVHGYRLPGDGYDRLMKTVASAGYVVAAAEHPHTTGHGGDGQRSDLTNQPADLTFVADQVVALGSTVGAPTPPIRDPQRIAVVGHSDGGLTATAFGYGQRFRDPRVVAVASLTGGVALFPGPFFAGADLPALLAVHARDDHTNPYSASASLFRSVPSGRPAFLLTLDAGDHIDPYMFATGRVDVGDAIAAFLDHVVGQDPAALARLQHLASAPGMTLEAHG
jgi:dienelactone hydrolase